MAKKKDCVVCGGKLYHSGKLPANMLCPSFREQRARRSREWAQRVREVNQDLDLREERRAALRKLYVERKSAGLCIQCGWRPARAGNVRCSTHAAAHLLKVKAAHLTPEGKALRRTNKIQSDKVARARARAYVVVAAHIAEVADWWSATMRGEQAPLPEWLEAWEV